MEIQVAIVIGYWQFPLVIRYSLLWFIHPFTKLRQWTVTEHTKENSFTLLVSNVRMDNDDKESFHVLVKKYNPDVLLINEPDQEWAASIKQA
jgi:endonuclease/exonuclease/phosphatase (EEP) superfamily protein YafD